MHDDLRRIRLRRRAARVEGLTRPSPMSADEPLEALLTGAVPFLVQQEPAVEVGLEVIADCDDAQCVPLAKRWRLSSCRG